MNLDVAYGALGASIFIALAALISFRLDRYLAYRARIRRRLYGEFGR